MNQAPQEIKPGIAASLNSLALAVDNIEKEVGLITERTKAFRVAVPVLAKAAPVAPAVTVSDIEAQINDLTTRLHLAREALINVTDGIRN